MTRQEVLKHHLEQLKTARESLQKARMEFDARGKAFNAWLHAEVKFPEDKTTEVLLPEILMAWDETQNAQP